MLMLKYRRSGRKRAGCSEEVKKQGGATLPEGYRKKVCEHPADPEFLSAFQGVFHSLSFIVHK
jgi:hypothetical protein